MLLTFLMVCVDPLGFWMLNKLFHHRSTQYKLNMSSNSNNNINLMDNLDDKRRRKRIRIYTEKKKRRHTGESDSRTEEQTIPPKQQRNKTGPPQKKEETDTRKWYPLWCQKWRLWSPPWRWEPGTVSTVQHGHLCWPVRWLGMGEEWRGYVCSHCKTTYTYHHNWDMHDHGMYN